MKRCVCFKGFADNQDSREATCIEVLRHIIV